MPRERDCVDIVSTSAEPTRNFYRVRFRNPKLFVGGKYSTPQWGQKAAMTIGTKYYGVSGCKITMAQPVGGRWMIQNVLIPKHGGVEMTEELALQIANHIQDRIEREGQWSAVLCRDNETKRYVSQINGQHIVRDSRGRFAPHAAEEFSAEYVGYNSYDDSGYPRISKRTMKGWDITKYDLFGGDWFIYDLRKGDNYIRVERPPRNRNRTGIPYEGYNPTVVMEEELEEIRKEEGKLYRKKSAILNNLAAYEWKNNPNWGMDAYRETTYFSSLSSLLDWLDNEISQGATFDDTDNQNKSNPYAYSAEEFGAEVNLYNDGEYEYGMGFITSNKEKYREKIISKIQDSLFMEDYEPTEKDIKEGYPTGGDYSTWRKREEEWLSKKSDAQLKKMLKMAYPYGSLKKVDLDEKVLNIAGNRKGLDIRLEAEDFDEAGYPLNMDRFSYQNEGKVRDIDGKELRQYRIYFGDEPMFYLNDAVFGYDNNNTVQGVVDSLNEALQDSIKEVFQRLLWKSQRPDSLDVMLRGEEFGMESFRVGDEGMFEGGEVRITSIEDNSEDGRQNVYFFTYLDEEGNSDGFTHTSGERRFLNQFSMFPRDLNAEEFEAQRIQYDYIVHREPRGTEVDDEGNRIPNPRGGWFTSAPNRRDAEEFGAEGEVYVLRFGDPMRYGKPVELPFLTKNEALRYVDIHIRPHNRDRPNNQIVYSITQETQELGAEEFEATNKTRDFYNTCSTQSFNILGRKLYYRCSHIGTFTGAKSAFNKGGLNTYSGGQRGLRTAADYSDIPIMNTMAEISQEMQPNDISDWREVISATNQIMARNRPRR